MRQGSLVERKKREQRVCDRRAEIVNDGHMVSKYANSLMTTPNTPLRRKNRAYSTLLSE